MLLLPDSRTIEMKALISTMAVEEYRGKRADVTKKKKVLRKLKFKVSKSQNGYRIDSFLVLLKLPGRQLQNVILGQADSIFEEKEQLIMDNDLNIRASDYQLELIHDKGSEIMDDDKHIVNYRDQLTLSGSYVQFRQCRFTARNLNVSLRGHNH
ncbi:hypothetical protein PoB_003837300 [Plakobranchus ocellatus]|uniref:Uncharacterized protein n=1 Tax=Plakobranchus ocellatus TaxID=259542 RepID=A0AAV4AYE3_9GAST|nr:hypothetical protein PoB_003837300 [Plakobranchus ocellatus]